LVSYGGFHQACGQEEAESKDQVEIGEEKERNQEQNRLEAEVMDYLEFAEEELLEHIPGEKHVFELLDPTWRIQQLDYVAAWMEDLPYENTGMFGASINGSLVCFEWGELENFE
jgi:hypothetical protein